MSTLRDVGATEKARIFAVPDDARAGALVFAVAAGADCPPHPYPESPTNALTTPNCQDRMAGKIDENAPNDQFRRIVGTFSDILSRMAARTTTPAPLEWFDGSPRYGSYQGDLGTIDWKRFTPNALSRIAREKRWLYVALSTDRFYIAVCVVRLGYASNAFMYVFDKSENALRVHQSATSHPFAASISPTITEGARVVFDASAFRARCVRLHGSATYSLDVTVPGCTLNVELDTSGAPPSIAAIASLAPGHANTTQKRALLQVRGNATIGAERISLDGAQAAYDYTSGILERHTSWKWAFGLGHAADGSRIGFNLVEGFVGESECAFFSARNGAPAEMHPLREGRFSFDRKHPKSKWRLATDDGAVDLTFSPLALHAETKNLGIVRSSFVQPIGLWNGTVRAGGTAYVLNDVLGVAEDQDVVW